jgi:SAM-dependent methyltransferase
MQATARYDGIADWYETWIGQWPGPHSEYKDLLPWVSGLRVLDVACGLGRMSRYLAARGAAVVGVDLSAALVEKARSNGDAGIEYLQGDITQPERWWNGGHFEGCTCELALMDIDDLGGTLATIATVLRPRGWFVASIVHPCFPGNDTGLSSWPPDAGYSTEGWWTSPGHDPEGVRIRVGSTHRTVSTYINGLLEAGFELERLVEPPASVPTFLLWRCRRR